jgi:UDP-N-acetylglucosamine 2-epimerase (non-hydrolysing)
MSNLTNTIWVILGTRPEAIKQAPVYIELCRRVGKKNVSLVGTGQHKELLNQALKAFGLELDLNLNVMSRAHGLADTSGLILQEMDAAIKKYNPCCLIVQGDTTTAAMAGMAAFYNKILVIHNEAGLRSYDNQNPFPEEVNRKILTIVSEVHLAPTVLSQEVLIKEGIAPEDAFMTGNTGIDALMFALRLPASYSTQRLIDQITKSQQRIVLMTAHRRENAGQSMEDWISSVRDYFLKHPDLALIFPLHPNNLARIYAEEQLGRMDNCHLIEPLDYIDCCHVINYSHFVVTDSGGIQEEASTLGVPVVVCRKTTERMEAVYANRAILAGQNIDSVLSAMDWANDKALSEIRTARNIYGDGSASEKICDIIISRLAHVVAPIKQNEEYFELSSR